MTLPGKYALVTGSGTGIGLAIAQKLAQQGASVTITGRRLEILKTASGPDIYSAVMDVIDERSMTVTVAAAVAARGPDQICVASAGIAQGRALHKTEMALWRQIIATNLDGAFSTMRECFKSMHGTDWGRMIAISSIAGMRGMKGAGAYAASKYGVIGMIRSFSEDHLTEPFTFNAICPRYVEASIIAQNIDLMQQKGLSRQDPWKLW